MNCESIIARGVAPGWGCCICHVYNGMRRPVCRDCGHYRCGLNPCSPQVSTNLAGSRAVLSAIELEALRADIRKFMKDNPDCDISEKTLELLLQLPPDRFEYQIREIFREEEERS